MPEGTIAAAKAAGKLCESVRIEGLKDLESAIAAGPLRGWESLLRQDPTSTLFQGPAWSMPWYRAYRERFTPLILATMHEGELVGVVPLAIERGSRRLTFAGDNMADYSDIVAAPAFREEVVRGLIRVYRDGNFGSVFRLGSTLPESDTASIAGRISKEERVESIYRTHMGCRWWRELATEDPFKKRAIRYSLKRIERSGPVVAEVLRERRQWEELREEFFDQHSLRQLYGARQVAFDSAEKREFFEAVFDAPVSHVTVLRAGGRLIACHFDFISDGVLFWGPPSFDVRDRQHSPGLLTISMIMKHAGEWGVRGFDLTMGEGLLKESCSNSRVNLPMIELYASRGAYRKRRMMDRGIAMLRRRFSGDSEDKWKKQVRPRLIELAGHLRAAVRMRPALGWRYAQETLFADLARREQLVAFEAPSAISGLADPADMIGRNRIYDLLKGPTSGYVGHQLSSAAKKLPSTSEGKRDFHSLVQGDRILAWGFSNITAEPAESGIEGFTIPAAAGLLQDFDALPGEAQALERLIRSVAAERRAEGAQQVWLLASNPDRGAFRAITQAGFTPKCALQRSKLLKRTRQRVKHW